MLTLKELIPAIQMDQAVGDRTRDEDRSDRNHHMTDSLDRATLVTWLMDRARAHSVRSKTIVDGSGDLLQAADARIRCEECFALAEHLALRGNMPPPAKTDIERLARKQEE